MCENVCVVSCWAHCPGECVVWVSVCGFSTVETAISNYPGTTEPTSNCSSTFIYTQAGKHTWFSSSAFLISCWGVTVKTGLLVGRQTQNTQTHRQKAAMTIKHWGERKWGKKGFSKAGEDGKWPFRGFLEAAWICIWDRHLLFAGEFSTGSAAWF